MTLIEVVISIFVLSVGVIGILALFPSGYRLSQTAIDRRVATLAAQDALIRILAEVKGTSSSILPIFKTSDALCQINQRDRVGTIAAVTSDHTVDCYVCGDVSPQGTSTSPHYWPNLGTGYYLLMTSGACAGTFYSISSVGAKSIALVQPPAQPHVLRYTPVGQKPATAGDPIRVGDHFALIGCSASNGVLQCFPRSTSSVPPDPPTHPSITADFTATSGRRTMPVATEGDSMQVPWAYSYGVIISPPSPEMRRLCRADVFVYRRFDTTAGALNRPAAWIVTFVPNFLDATDPEK